MQMLCSRNKTETLERLKGVENIFDDIIVHNASEKEHYIFNAVLKKKKARQKVQIQNDVAFVYGLSAR